MSTQLYTLDDTGAWVGPGRSGGSTFVDGTTKPWVSADGSANVGVPAGTTLTTYNGNFNLTTDGTILDGLDIHGNVKVNANNCVIRNCRIRGYQISSGSSVGESTVALVQTPSQNAGLNLLVENCTLIPDFPSWDWDGVLSHDVTLHRCLIAHVTDGMGVYNVWNSGGPVNVDINSCFIGFMAWFSPTDSGNSDNATHNDCVQVLGGTNTKIRNSTLLGMRSMPDGLGVYDDPFGYVGQAGLTVAPAGYDAGTSGAYNPTYPSPASGSVIQFNNQQGTPQVVIDNCWMDGGGASVNISVPLAAGSAVTNNRFGHNQRLQGAGGDDTYTINGGGTSGANLTVSGNVYEDNGDAVRWRQ